MATLVKIKGLDRGDAVSRSSTSRVTANNGFRVPDGRFTQDLGGVAASKTIGTGNAAVTVTANWKGASGNNIQYGQVVSGTNTAFSIVVTYAANTGYPTITVNAATDGGGLSTTTAATAAAAINADPVASQYITAAAGGTGASVIVAGAAAALTSGADNATPNLQAVNLVANSKNIVVVDLDDPTTRKLLRRNNGRFVSLGQP